MMRFVQYGVAAMLLLVFAFAAPAPTAAQDLPEGMWSGSVFTPDGEDFDVQFAVAGSGDAITIAMVVPGQGEMPFENIAFEDGTLSFVLPIPGVEIICTLEADDEGTYNGDCVGDDGMSGVMTMTPPA